MREKVQRAAMGALAVLVVDRNARTRMLHMDPGLELIFGLTENLPGCAIRLPSPSQRRWTLKEMRVCTHAKRDFGEGEPS